MKNLVIYSWDIGGGDKIYPVRMNASYLIVAMETLYGRHLICYLCLWFEWERSIGRWQSGTSKNIKQRLLYDARKCCYIGVCK